MSTETLKISLAQKILSISDVKLLQKLKAFIEKENIIGYDAEGNPVSEKKYINEMNSILDEINEGKATLFTTEEVRKIILDENNLA